MPEGHALHRLARDLRAGFGDRPVRASSPQGRFADGAALIDGRPLTDVEAHGKHLLAEIAGGDWLHIHLGLIGQLALGAVPAPPPTAAVRLRLEGEPAVVYADLRGATVCELITPGERAALFDRLGPDPLRADADPQRAWARIHHSRLPIGQLLMDQSVLSGVGNIYRAEILFRARLHPRTSGDLVRPAEWRAMWLDLVTAMTDGLASGRIDTVAAAHTPEAMGRPARVDNHGGEVYVYRRAGQRCYVCDQLIRTQVLAGRNLFWCPRCQRAGPARHRR